MPVPIHLIKVLYYLNLYKKREYLNPVVFYYILMFQHNKLYKKIGEIVFKDEMY
jgi:hypothetical protein